MSKTENKVAHMDTTMAFVDEYQNLNSGNLRMKGLNSPSFVADSPTLLVVAAGMDVGSPGSACSASSSSSSAARDGSNFG